MFDVRPGERRLAVLFFLFFLLLEVAHYAAKSVRQATYVDALGAEKLPWVYLTLAVLSFPVLLGYTRVVHRFRHSTLVIASGAGLIGLLVVFWVLFGLGVPGTAPAFFVVSTIGFGLVVSQFWTWAAHVFDARQARRLFALIGAGGLLGGVPGGMMAAWISKFADTRATLLAAAVTLVAVVVVAVAISRSVVGSVADAPAVRPVDMEQARGGFAAIRSSRLLMLIVALMALMVVVSQMVELQFTWAVQLATTDLDQRTSVFGVFFSLMGLFAFVFQILLTQRIHRGIGVGAGLRVLPATVSLFGSVVVALMAFGGLPGVVYAMIWVLKLSETGLRHSVDQASRELLFVPVPGSLRRPAKAFIDVFVQRGAKGLGAVLLLPVTFHWVGPVHLAIATVVAAVTWLVVTTAVRRRYLEAFRAGLKPDLGDHHAHVDPGDAATVTALVESVASADPGRVLRGLELLSSMGGGRMVSPLLVHHDDPRVRTSVLELLAASDRQDALPQIIRATEDADPAVRAAALRTLASLHADGALRTLENALTDAEPRARAAAAAGLLALADGPAAQSGETVLAAMATHDDRACRLEAARTLAYAPEPRGAMTLVQLLYDEDVRVVEEALATVRRRAERDGGNPLYAPTVIAMTLRRRLRQPAREALVAFGDASVDALVHFMTSEDEHLFVRASVPRILAQIGTESAGRALATQINAPEVLLRAEAIDALAFVQRRHGIRVCRPRQVRAAIEEDCRRYLRDLADLWSVSSLHQLTLDGPWAVWPVEARVPTLLQHVLASRMAISAGAIFRLLELVLEPDDVLAARRSFASGQPGLRARALEFLDNTLAGSLRRHVGCVIDDAPPEDKLRRAEEWFGIVQESPEATVRRLLGAWHGDRQRAPVLASAAIYTVVHEAMRELYDAVEGLAVDAADDLVRETARWAVRSIRGEEAGESMSEMTRIEKMAFLQGVDVFARLNADETLQLAMIANERRVARGDVIYRRDDPPDWMFAVVDGRVRLEGAADDRRIVGPSGRFGVFDILSSRPRACTAVAEEDTHLLGIEADDFFDLLVGNVGIVKALFRQVLRDDRGTGVR